MSEAQSPAGLEQRCPTCGRREAAGWFCSGCTRKMGPGDWQARQLSEAQRLARSKNGSRRTRNSTVAA